MFDRRAVLTGIAASGAALALAPVITEAAPATFDAAAYIRDLRATGVVIEVYGDMLALDLRHCDDDAYMAVCLKWHDVRRADPLRNAKVAAALLVEGAAHV